MFLTDKLSCRRLGSGVVMPPFDCGDADLNDFLFNDADAYQTERMAVTHLLEYNNNQTTEIVGYFCLLNDKLVFDLSDKEKKKWWKMFNKKNQIHFNKHRKSYPAVKIGRLAVAQSFSGKGLGRYMMYMIIGMVANITDIACRFITVDAYQDAFGFYLKNGFEFLSSEDEADKTRLMYFDLKQMSLD